MYSAYEKDRTLQGVGGRGIMLSTECFCLPKILDLKPYPEWDIRSCSPGR